jgi:hypothetical protein
MSAIPFQVCLSIDSLQVTSARKIVLVGLHRVWLGEAVFGPQNPQKAECAAQEVLFPSG